MNCMSRRNVSSGWRPKQFRPRHTRTRAINPVWVCPPCPQSSVSSAIRRCNTASRSASVCKATTRTVLGGAPGSLALIDAIVSKYLLLDILLATSLEAEFPQESGCSRITRCELRLRPGAIRMDCRRRLRPESNCGGRRRKASLGKLPFVATARHGATVTQTRVNLRFGYGPSQ